MQKIKKFLRITGTVGKTVLFLVIGILVLQTVWLSVDKYVVKSEVPSFLGVSYLVVVTESMSGTVEAGDLVVVVRQSEYQAGDVITFMPEGASTTVTHRIVRIVGDKYYTKGDANNAEDTAPVYFEQIVGEVKIVVNEGGFVIGWLRSGGIVYIAVLIGAISALFYVLGRNQEEIKDGE